RAGREHLVWIPQMLSKPEVIQILTHSTVFVCPSLYEPMGIVNLEAMACETAVVATATGGIPEVVADGATGLLVPIEQARDGSGTPVDPQRFVADLAAAIRAVLEDPSRAAELGRAGRTDHVCDPENPRRVGGAFGDKSVLQCPEYTEPEWLTMPEAPGEWYELTVPAPPIRADVKVRVWSPPDPGDRLLVAHDGPE